VPNRILTVNDDRDVYINIENWNDLFDVNWDNTLTGNFRVHRNFYSHALDETRTVMIYLPPGYSAKKERYPVFYLHDGQNVFDASTSYGGVEWEVDETAQRLINGGKIQKLIIVGIYNDKDRADEYTESYDPDEHAGGKVEYYADFIINELKPFIDKNYRTKKDAENTAVMGSSLGGLCSLYLGWKHRDVFSKAGVVSPSLWWNDREILKEIEDDEDFQGPHKMWLDVGTLEGNDPEQDGITDMVENTRYLEKLLLKKGYVLNENLFYFEAEGKGHSEAAWKERVEKILLALFSI
jgi:predicted alpha/beta superfamily hydrolase